MAKVTVETDLDTLLASMDEWKPGMDSEKLGDDSAFTDFCASTFMHGNALMKLHHLKAPFHYHAAEKLGISVPTFRRWCFGGSVPHPALRPRIVAALRQLLIDLRDGHAAVVAP